MKKLFSVFITLILTGCGSANQESTPEPRPLLVSTAEVTKADVPVILSTMGTLAAYQSVAIVPQVQGMLTAIHFQEGERISEGKLLFQIEDTRYRIQVIEAGVALARLEAELEFSKKELKRLEGLAREKVISEKEYNKLVHEVALKEVTAKGDRARLEGAELQLALTTIKAPIAGISSKIEADIGRQIAPGQPATLTTIRQVDQLFVDFALSERDLQKIRDFHEEKPLVVECQLPHNETVIPGQLTFIDNQVDSRSGTIKLRALLPNSDGALWPGQLVRVRVMLTTEPNQTMVPVEAIQVSEEGPYLFIVNEESVVAQKFVEVGIEDGSHVVVRSDEITGGEKVVTDGHLMIRDGSKVSTSIDDEGPQ